MSQYSLKPHQEQAVKFLLETPKAALFMATGTGKTLTSLVYAKILNLPTLVVVEATKKHIWIDDNIKFSLGLKISTDYREPAQIVLISYDTLKNYPEIVEDYEVIIFDEANCISDPDTIRYQSMFNDVLTVTYKGRRVCGPTFDRDIINKYLNSLDFNDKLKHKVERKKGPIHSRNRIVLLAGYPVENHLQEIFVVSLISDVLGKNYFHFLNKFFNVIKHNGRTIKVKPKVGAFDQIVSLISPFTFLVDKSVIMPENVKKETIVTRFELSDEQKDIIIELQQTGSCNINGEIIQCKNGLVVFQKMMQIISGFVYKTNDQEEKYPVILNSNPKLELLDKLVKDNSNFLIWYLYDYEKEILSKYEGVARLCKLQTDSRGLNLQEYKFAVYFTLPLSGGQYLQSQDRIYRMGRETDVLSVSLLPTGEFGNHLSKMMDRKAKLTDKFIKSLLNCRVK